MDNRSTTNEHPIKFFGRNVLCICPECEGEGMLWLSDDGSTYQKVLRCEMCNCIGCLLDLPEGYVPPFNKTARSFATSKVIATKKPERYDDEGPSVEHRTGAKDSESRLLAIPQMQKEKQVYWTCQKCGDDECWSALLAGTEQILSDGLLAMAPIDVSSADYCPDCFWCLVTGEEPTPDLLPTMRERRGYGVSNVQPGRSGPHDDTSPGYDDATRKREGD